KGLQHRLATAPVDGGDRVEIEALLETGILEHGKRLSAVIDEHLLAAEPAPGEVRLGVAAGEKKAVLLVDLGKMHRRRLFALLDGGKTLGGGGLHDVGGAGEQARYGGRTRWG